jgi:pimeloyl-ACP methyl ester carboxylesterase
MHLLETAEADIAYDVRGPLPAADGRPPLFMIGQPMDASGFATLASYFPDRTVVTYDPRGLGRSTRKDGRVDNAPEVQAGDVHAVIEALGAAPVEMFASSGGAVTALALVAPTPTTWPPWWHTSHRSSRCSPTPRRPSAPARACGTPTKQRVRVLAWPPSSR